MTSRRGWMEIKQSQEDRQSYEDFMKEYKKRCGEPMLVDCQSSIVPSDGDPTGTFQSRKHQRRS